MKTLTERYEQFDEKSSESRFDSLENSAKELAYGFEQYPELSTLYKKADSLLMAVQKQKKKIISVMDG